MTIAARLLGKTSNKLDFVTRQFSTDLLVAVMLSMALPRWASHVRSRPVLQPGFLIFRCQPDDA